MLMRPSLLVVVLAGMTLLPTNLAAQRPQTREGFWISFGVGWGNLSWECDGCPSQDHGGPTGFLRLGGAPSQKVLLAPSGHHVPLITSAPTNVVYGQSLFVETPDGAGITQVSFIRFGSVTHAFDAGTRLVPLTFSQVSGGLQVTIPASATTAPPGPYMLFLVNGSGVPSVSRIMRLQ